MSTSARRMFLEMRYHEAEQAYLRGLPPEHFMEATSQATQRKITVESLDLVHAVRPDIQIFNELLVQYPLPRRKKPGQVVPDNMVVIHSEPIKAVGSFNTPLQPVGPIWVLEYVSQHNKRKDYQENFDKYEHQLKVPYYLLFNPEIQEVNLYHHTGERYDSVTPNENGRLAIPDLELELGLLDGWVRFWFRGKLLPLPADLQREVDELTLQLQQKDVQLQQKDVQLQQKDVQLQEAEQRAAAHEKEIARLKAQLEQSRQGPKNS
jgi:Uma2 family endonuclease